MQISSIIKDSFQEYEGEHSLVLFSHGCNLNCYHCYNYNRITSDIIGDAISKIDTNITPLHSAVVLLGGEPTIHKDIDQVCKHIKSLHLKVKLYTNGMLPDIVNNLIQKNLLDSISVDIKSVTNVSELTGIYISNKKYLTSIKKIVEAASNIDIELRTTIFDISDKDAIYTYVKLNFPKIRHIFQKEYKLSNVGVY